MRSLRQAHSEVLGACFRLSGLDPRPSVSMASGLPAQGACTNGAAGGNMSLQLEEICNSNLPPAVLQPRRSDEPSAAIDRQEDRSFTFVFVVT